MFVIPIELQILIFSVSGVTLKLADHWGELEHKLPAYFTAILTAAFFGWLAAQNPLNGALIFGLLLGVIVAQKVDRGNLGVGVIATVLFAILFNAPLPSLCAKSGRTDCACRGLRHRPQMPRPRHLLTRDRVFGSTFTPPLTSQLDSLGPQSIPPCGSGQCTYC